MEPENLEIPIPVAVEIPLAEGYIIAKIKRQRVYDPPTGYYFW